MSCWLLSLKSLLWAITSTPSQAERQSGTFLSNINLLPISFSPPNCFHLRLTLFVGLVVLQPWLPQKEPALLTGTSAGFSAAGWPAGWPASSGSTSFATLCHAASIPACPSEVPRSSVDVREPTVSRNPASPKGLQQTSCTATQTTFSTNCTIKQSFTRSKLYSCVLL